MIHKYRSRLPHWEMEGAYYFITFTTRNDILTNSEIKPVHNQIVLGVGKYFDFLALQVMPDHVHLIINLKDGVSLGKVMKWIKGSTARLINKLRGKQGSLWRIDYHDRIIRHQQEFDEKLKYMYENPLRSKLTEDAELYIGWYFQTE